MGVSPRPAGGQKELRVDSAGLHEEACAMVDAARARGLTLRLVGGLAALSYCADPAICRRSHRDIDLVGLRREVQALAAVLAESGFEENPHVRLASAGQLAQFFRPCRHVADGVQMHPDDRVDVYLDSFRLHHEIKLARRLRLHDYAVSASDALLVKLQRTTLDESDLADAVSLLAGTTFGTGANELDAHYIARLCGRDWGLWHDVRRSLGLVEELAGELCPSGEEARRVSAAAAELRRRIDDERKSLRWRIRSLAGERIPWHEVVDEREGLRVTARERPAG